MKNHLMATCHRFFRKSSYAFYDSIQLICKQMTVLRDDVCWMALHINIHKTVLHTIATKHPHPYQHGGKRRREYFYNKSSITVSFYCARIPASRSLGRNSVRLSVVCHTRALWLIQITCWQYFLYYIKRQSFKFFTTQQWLVGVVPFHLKRGELNDPLPSKITHVDRLLPVMCQQ